MYKIHNKEFKTKDDIKSYLIEVVYKQLINRTMDDDDFELVKECIGHVPRFKEVKDDITKIMCERTLTKGDITIYKINFIVNKLKYGRKHKREDKLENVFINTLVSSVPPVKASTIEYVFKFGKYKGVNIKDVEEQYLRWISGPDSSLNPVEKKMITQFLKYGFIPFNPKHYSK